MDNISAKMSALRGKVSELERAAAQRKAKLDENSAFLQFNWKADVVESWIGINAYNVFIVIVFCIFKASTLQSLILQLHYYSS